LKCNCYKKSFERKLRNSLFLLLPLVLLIIKCSTVMSQTIHVSFMQNRASFYIYSKHCKKFIPWFVVNYQSFWYPLTFIYLLINILFANKNTNLYQSSDYQFIITKIIYTSILFTFVINSKLLRPLHKTNVFFLCALTFLFQVT
jgi:hypothetical protein